ncbi:MAG: methylated-DNA--[protein]-cysteine S-methyltransferase [Lachnospiraceae bacterium]|nr:methylated-DNA--[protein]-cysteine S-methyltransferase [Lachnospiraceae bacterium]
MVAAPVGELELVEDGQGICGLSFGASSENEDVLEEETALLSEAKRQLLEYFAGERKKFELPLSMHGTKFQMRDWEELLAIPYGETRSYGEIARAIGCPKGCRAVGMANRNNPIAIIVPCHRVIGSNGSLTGYAGKNKALDIKEYLLKLEGVKLEGAKL